MEIKSLKLIDGDTFVVGAIYGTAKVVSIESATTQKSYVVKTESGGKYLVPITAVLFARLTETE